MCVESQQGCLEREECIPHNPGKRNHCYVLWQLDRATIKLKGCFLDSKECYDKPHTVLKTMAKKKNYSSVAAMALCATRISHGIGNPQNDRTQNLCQKMTNNSSHSCPFQFHC